VLAAIVICGLVASGVASWRRPPCSCNKDPALETPERPSWSAALQDRLLGPSSLLLPAGSGPPEVQLLQLQQQPYGPNETSFYSEWIEQDLSLWKDGITQEVRPAHLAAGAAASKQTPRSSAQAAASLT
jgi:hypothetical protein